MELNVFVELLDGSRKQIGGMTLFSWVCSADTPADSLKVRCLQQIDAEIACIEVQSGGRRLFRGFCDRQKTFVDGTGCHTELWGRSDAAVLMDNEAIPQEYSRVTLQELFEKHIKPYGFQNDLPQAATLNYFRVGKGVSEWEAFSDGCIQALGQQPFVHLVQGQCKAAGEAKPSGRCAGCGAAPEPGGAQRKGDLTGVAAGRMGQVQHQNRKPAGTGTCHPKKALPDSFGTVGASDSGCPAADEPVDGGQNPLGAGAGETGGLATGRPGPRAASRGWVCRKFNQQGASV